MGIDKPTLILHIAPFNVAGVPLSFVKAERALGYYSRLITLGQTQQKREEDLSLDLPLLNSPITRLGKFVATPADRRIIDNKKKTPKTIPITWEANGILENSLVKAREFFWRPIISNFLKSFNLFEFDIIQLDGGLGFFRDSHLIQQLKQSGKKLICCYTGSDLRTRGVIPTIDRLSDLNVTVEFDHLQYHPNIHHVPFPSDLSFFTRFKKAKADKKEIIIGHAPTNRLAKGSDVIIRVVQELASRYPIHLELIENLPYETALEKKADCDLFIDQLGDLGYGMNGVESLALGIPTFTSIVTGFDKIYPDHPFIAVDECTLREKLEFYIIHTEQRLQKGIEGMQWVQKTHDAISVVKKIHNLVYQHTGFYYEHN